MLKTLGTQAKAPTRSGFRRAFTLVELMVVIAIIGFLAAVTTTVVVKVIESQRRASTKVLVDAINTALSSQASKLVDQVRKNTNNSLELNADVSIKEYTLQEWTNIFTPTIEDMAAKDVNNNYIHPSYVKFLAPMNLDATNKLNGLLLPSGDTVSPTAKKATPVSMGNSVALFVVLKMGKYSTFDPETMGRGAVQYATGPGNLKVPFIADQWGDPIGFRPNAPGTPPEAFSLNQ